jgi:uncharacterized protein with GYD domain
MPLYMSQINYTAEHLSSLARNPEDRTARIRGLVEQHGGRLLGFYYSLGEYDAVTLIEAPNEKAITAVLLAALGGGHIRASKTITLLPAADAVEAMRQAGGTPFTPTGGR